MHACIIQQSAAILAIMSLLRLRAARRCVPRRLSTASQASAAAVGSAGSGAGPGGPARLRLFQYELCPFCCKAKAVLDHEGYAYDTVDVEPLTKAQLKGIGSDYRKVPVALFDGEQVNGSGAIIARAADELQRHRPDFAARRAAFLDGPDVAEAMRWADERLAVLLFPNICRSVRESLQAFEYVLDVPGISAPRRYLNYALGGFAMAMASGKIKKKYGIGDERAALLSALADWEGMLGGRPFHGGERPNAGDLAVYGVMKSIDRTDAYADMLAGTTDAVRDWYARTADAVGKSARTARQ